MLWVVKFYYKISRYWNPLPFFDWMNDQFSEGMFYFESAIKWTNSSSVQHKQVIHELLGKNQESVSDYSRDISRIQGEKSGHLFFSPLGENKKTQRGSFISQVRAILRKNLALQVKQRGTNICQVKVYIDWIRILNFFSQRS